MNENLKFSWGHIIAFLALIAVSYISFVGFTYLTNGNFNIALTGMGITDTVFIIFFIGAQQMKASGVRMKQKIVWERIFILGSPIVFVAGMISMSHFWTVKSQNDAIVATFQQAINNSKQLFDDYDNYAANRISTYEKKLGDIIVANGTDSIAGNATDTLTDNATDPLTYAKAGFEPSKDLIQRNNMVETLRLQLLSQNYYSLKEAATKWIDGASQGASTWNVFLLGNTREIKEALHTWEDQLKSFSAKEMSNEWVTGEVPHFHSDGAQTAIAGIDSLTASFTTKAAPNIMAIIFGIIIYLMLIFPYLLQERHTKTPYKNLFTKINRESKIGFDKSDPKKSSSTNNNRSFTLD